jgi:hypothetical protein
MSASLAALSDEQVAEGLISHLMKSGCDAATEALDYNLRTALVPERFQPLYRLIMQNCEGWTQETRFPEALDCLDRQNLYAGDIPGDITEDGQFTRDYLEYILSLSPLEDVAGHCRELALRWIRRDYDPTTPVGSQVYLFCALNATDDKPLSQVKEELNIQFTEDGFDVVKAAGQVNNAGRALLASEMAQMRVEEEDGAKCSVWRWSAPDPALFSPTEIKLSGIRNNNPETAILA